MLKSWETTKINLKLDRYSDEELDAIKIYYTKAREILLKYPFKNAKQKRVWELFSEGYSEREIEKLVGLIRNQVRVILKKIKKANGLP